MDFFLIDTCGRSKIRCVSNCYSYSSDWTTDILLCLQYGHSSTCSWSNLVAKVAGEKGGGDGGLVNESVDGVKMSTGTPDFPNAALAMKDWEDKKERKNLQHVFQLCCVNLLDFDLHSGSSPALKKQTTGFITTFSRQNYQMKSCYFYTIPFQSPVAS